MYTEQTKAVIIGDSIVKDLATLKDVEVHTIRGATQIDILKYLKSKGKNIMNQCNPKVLIIHVGTNHLGTKREWGLYRDYRLGNISEINFKNAIDCLNPMPANGTATQFHDTFCDIISTIHSTNPEITVLISSILPRPWDFERRSETRMIYNRLLKTLNSKENVFYIPSYRPFLDQNKNINQDCFMPDGLHLSKKGSEQLKSFYQEKIDKAIRKALK